MSLVQETLERMTRYTQSLKRRTPAHLARFITREFNEAVNAEATQASHLDDDKEVVWDSTVLVEVEDPTSPNGVRTFKVTIEEWDI